MPGELLARQVYRMYAVAVAILGGWTYLWTTNTVSMSTTNLGYGWLAIAGIGVVLTAWMTLSRPKLFNTKHSRTQKFNQSALSGAPLNAYLGALGVLAVASAAAAGGLVVLDATILGYAWIATALYGGVITVSLASQHSEAVQSAVSPAEN